MGIGSVLLSMTAARKLYSTPGSCYHLFSPRTYHLLRLSTLTDKRRVPQHQSALYLPKIKSLQKLSVCQLTAFTAPTRRYSDA